MGTFLQLSGIIGSESRENSPFIRSSCAPQTHPHRRISPNPPQESFCGFFVFWKFLQARYNFVRSFLQMGAMIDTDGGNAPDKQSGQRCGAACCRKVRRSPPRRANGGKLVCACLFLPRGSSERPRFFVCGQPGANVRGSVAGSERKNRREAGGFLCQREMSSIATGRVTMDKMVPVA